MTQKLILTMLMFRYCSEYILADSDKWHILFSEIITLTDI